MADHLTEEEQIEAIKRWWKENWLSLVLPIVVAIAAYTGWNFWQDQKAQSAQMASEKYQTLLGFFEAPSLSESEQGQALLLAEEIASSYSGSLYADLSRLIAARVAVEKNDLGKAQEILLAVVDEGKTDAVVQVAKARLARVHLSEGRYDQAAALVDSTDHESTKSLYAEIRGDAYLAKGQHDAARTAYEEALASLTPNQANQAAIVQFKLQGIAQSSTGAEPDLSSTEAEKETAPVQE